MNSPARRSIISVAPATAYAVAGAFAAWVVLVHCVIQGQVLHAANAWVAGRLAGTPPGAREPGIAGRFLSACFWSCPDSFDLLSTAFRRRANATRLLDAGLVMTPPHHALGGPALVLLPLAAALAYLCARRLRVPVRGTSACALLLLVLPPFAWFITFPRSAAAITDPARFQLPAAYLGGLLVPLAVLYVLLAMRGRLRRGGREGVCGWCGYESGPLPRCPECGRLTGDRPLLRWPHVPRAVRIAALGLVGIGFVWLLTLGVSVTRDDLLRAQRRLSRWALVTAYAEFGWLGGTVSIRCGSTVTFSNSRGRFAVVTAMIIGQGSAQPDRSGPCVFIFRLDPVSGEVACGHVIAPAYVPPDLLAGIQAALPCSGGRAELAGEIRDARSPLPVVVFRLDEWPSQWRVYEPETLAAKSLAYEGQDGQEAVASQARRSAEAAVGAAGGTLGACW